MPKGDIIIFNAAVLTMDPTRLRAESVALRGDRILAVGDHATISAMKTDCTRMIDAKGGSVLPGFIESHLHLFIGGSELGRVLLGDHASMEQTTRLMRTYAAAHPDDPVIVGICNGYNLFKEQSPRLALDTILSDRPLAMMSTDHHTVWANTAALEDAGILKGATTPSGHEVVMGADGLAEGTLREPYAYRPVMALAGLSRVNLGLDQGTEPTPYPNPNEIEADLLLLQRGLDYAVTHGITSLVNRDGNIYTLTLLDMLRDRGTLTARVKVPFHFVPDVDDVALEIAADMDRRWKDDWLSSGFVKMFMDGVLESGTAFTKFPYPGQRDWRGIGRFSA